MNTFGFKDYEGFKELFGSRTTGDGKVVRRNKVLLSFLTSKETHKFLVSNPGWEHFLSITDLTTLANELYAGIADSSSSEPDLYNIIYIGGRRFYTDKYKTDECGGVCVDGDVSKYRYINTESGRVFKMKIGKLFKYIIDGCAFGRCLPESVVLWLCEDITQQWTMYCQSKVGKYSLHIGDDLEDFEKIYDLYGDCRGDFHSCMSGGDHARFYVDAVDAKAAWLENDSGGIVARCIIYTKVHEVGKDKIWRLAERQYSSNLDDVLKRQLVYALIQAGEIDGYKKVGADCHDARNFVGIDDVSLNDRRFWIPCYLEDGDTLSYQDSFKNYDYDSHRADNYGDGDINLADTDETIHLGEQNYDEYHDCYTDNDLEDVYYDGGWITCDKERMEDFRYVDRPFGGRDGYYHYDYVVTCDRCGRDIHEDDVWYSDLTKENYCSEKCKDEAEDEYKADYWYYDDYNEEFVECESDLEEYHDRWGDDLHIAKDSVDWAVEHGGLVRFCGELYNGWRAVEANEPEVCNTCMEYLDEDVVRDYVELY